MYIILHNMRRVLPKLWKASGFHEGSKRITFIDLLPTVTGLRQAPRYGNINYLGGSF